MEYPWGYSLEYNISSLCHCTPSYANFLYGKHTLPIVDIYSLLEYMDEDKKKSFDSEYAFSMLNNYYSEVGTFDIVDKVKSFINKRNVLVVAPGRNAEKYHDVVESYIKKENPFIIAINNNMFNPEMIYVTRKDLIYDYIDYKGIVIAPKEISKCDSKIYAIDIKEFIDKNDPYFGESAGVVLLNLLAKIEVNEIGLVGFDGFLGDVNCNYYDENMRIPFTSIQADKRNKFYIKFFLKYAQERKIQFITPSSYNSF